jgi:two-component system, NarL family, sensor histidine kinase DegS
MAAVDFEHEIPGKPLSARQRLLQSVFKRGGVPTQTSVEDTTAFFLEDRFIARARALFYARLMLLTLGLLVLAVPVWREYFNFGPLAYAMYFFMLFYSVCNYVVLDSTRIGRIVTYVTLCLDLVAMVVVVSKPQAGGFQNPLLATQLVFTTLFALLYAKPLAALPPLLALPITIRIDQILNRSPTAIEIFTFVWYLALNIIIIYVLVYLNGRETQSQQEVSALQSELKEVAVIEERNRLSREIHDGLGASLSALILQAEYLLQLAKEPDLRKEIAELKTSAEDSIEELRRSLHMMREDFDAAQVMEDYVRTFSERAQLNINFQKSGNFASSLGPANSLTVFRILQECLANAAKHAAAKNVHVALHVGAQRVDLTVRDDGRGFDASAAIKGHYGLRNMRERAQAAKAHLEVESKSGVGTSVSFSMPTARS